MFRRTPSAPCRTCPAVEQLEDRQLMSANPLVFNGGPVMNTPHVMNVFWGSSWNDPKQLESTRNSLNGFTKYLLGSPFMDTLAQYGVGHGQFEGTHVFNGAPETGTVSAQFIQQKIQQMIQHGHHIPGWAVDRVFMVYLPPGVSIGAPGYHADNWTYGFDPKVNAYAYKDYVFAAISYSPGGNTVVGSHELAEAATDPRIAQGWITSNYQEVADLATPNTTTLNGYQVTQLWSNDAGAVVAP
jgi:hypothetical protein